MRDRIPEGWKAVPGGRQQGSNRQRANRRWRPKRRSRWSRHYFGTTIGLALIAAISVAHYLTIPGPDGEAFSLTTPTASAVAEGQIVGRASVIDGDTIEIHSKRIRILDIDAPESRQTCTRPDGSEWRCGQQATLALSDWIGAATVACETTKKDQYKRWLARCTVGGLDVAEWLAGQGWGVPYRDCSCEGVRAAAEHAQLEKRGIWSGDFQAPWEWRKAN